MDMFTVDLWLHDWYSLCASQIKHIWNMWENLLALIFTIPQPGYLSRYRYHTKLAILGYFLANHVAAGARPYCTWKSNEDCHPSVFRQLHAHEWCQMKDIYYPIGFDICIFNLCVPHGWFVFAVKWRLVWSVKFAVQLNLPARSYDVTII